MKSMLALKNFLLSGSLLSDFPNKNGLSREVSFCAHNVWVCRTYYIENRLSFKRISCVMEKEINGRLDTITTTTSKLYRILESVPVLSIV